MMTSTEKNETVTRFKRYWLFKVKTIMELSFTSGYVDLCSVYRSKVFVSSLSGNAVFLTMHIFELEGFRVIFIICVFACFVLGSFLTYIICKLRFRYIHILLHLVVLICFTFAEIINLTSEMQPNSTHWESLLLTFSMGTFNIYSWEIHNVKIVTLITGAIQEFIRIFSDVFIFKGTVQQHKIVVSMALIISYFTGTLLAGIIIYCTPLKDYVLFVLVTIILCNIMFDKIYLNTIITI